MYAPNNVSSDENKNPDSSSVKDNRNANVRSFLNKNFLEKQSKPVISQTTTNLHSGGFKRGSEASGLDEGEEIKFDDRNDSMRPGSSQANLNRQKFMEMQKEKLRNKQQMLYQNKGIVQNPSFQPSSQQSSQPSSQPSSHPSFQPSSSSSSNAAAPSFFGFKPSPQPTIESRIPVNIEREQYEPGSTGRKSLNLPGLKREETLITYKNNENNDEIEEIMLFEEPKKEEEKKIDNSINTKLESPVVNPPPTNNSNSQITDVEIQKKMSVVLQNNGKNEKPYKTEEGEPTEDILRLAKELQKLQEKNKGSLVINIIHNPSGNNQGSEIKVVETPAVEKNEKVTSTREKPLEKEEYKANPLEKRSKNKDSKDQKEEAPIAALNEKPDESSSIKIFNDFNIPNIKEFLLSPPPKNTVVQCVIRRERSGWAKLFPKYKVYFSLPKLPGSKSFQLGSYLMSAKKRSHNKSSNYLISLHADDFRKGSDQILGKLRSNFIGTEFHIYDTGENPKKARYPDNIRKELGVINYDTNFFGAKGPRKMKILIPREREEGGFYEWKPKKGEDGMFQTYKKGRRDGFTFLFNKPPKWNDNMGAFVLNFNGRVEKPSVKNFQLIDEEDENYVLLQFGRVSNEEFTMDYMYPMTGLQAFSICLSSFDYKFACE